MAETFQSRVEEVVLKTFEFIIVGGGTAGLTIAARLTENPMFNVLVLEAGENRSDDPKVNVPALMAQLYEDPTYDWCFKTVPQVNANNRVVAQPRGKLLGGSSSINFMMLSHASAVDVDNWEKLGNRGWNFKTMKPYYKKFETYNAPNEVLEKTLGGNIFDSSLHGSSGPVQITWPHGTSEVDGMWRPTLQALGLGAEEDPRRGSALGGYPVLKYIDKAAKRTTAATAFYIPNAGRSNLSVLTNAHVNRILFEEHSGIIDASAVSFSFSDKEYVVSASREIILCAGSFQSPQILELSGIGSKEILTKHGMKLVVDNPNVGENLQDHMLVPLEFETVDGVQTAETIKQPGVLEWALKEWQEGRGGPLASGVSGTAFLSYASILPKSDQDSIPKSMEKGLSATPSYHRSKQFEIQKQVFLSQKEASAQFNFARTGFNPFSSESVSGLFQHDDPGNYLGVATALTHPFSRGSVHINSSDPKALPIIDPRYLSHPIDIEVLANGLLFVQELVETAPLSSVIKDSPDGLGKKIQPSFKIDKKLDRERAVEFVREAAISSWHPIGTCSMLPRDEGGVVDEKMRVYGVNRLRVVDASVMPLHVRGNIASTVYAIAERAADLIKEDWVVENSH